MALFDIKDLTFTYPNREKPALQGINLTIEQGSYMCVCGKSGCGKTTLLLHLKSSLAPHGVLQGDILFQGMPLKDVDDRTQATSIGFVMQDPEAQIVTDKVSSELAFGLENLGYDQHLIQRRIAEVASYFNMQSWYGRSVNELSGGQKQLLNLAAIIAMDPDVLILDEPTSQLDPMAALNFLNTIQHIHEDLGTTMIICEHRLESVFTTADKVIVIEDGKILTDGKPEYVAATLAESDNEMLSALPTQIRIFCRVEKALFDQKQSDKQQKEPTTLSDNTSPLGEIPLSIKEGQRWLKCYIKDNDIKSRSVKDHQTKVSPSMSLPNVPAISLENIWLRYSKDDPDILRELNMYAYRNGIFAIVGGNGTGKTTILKTICGTVKPYRGKVNILGKKLSNWKDGQLFGNHLSMLPQNPRYLFAKQTILDDLMEMVSDLPSDEAKARALKLSTICGIDHLLYAHPYDISIGELQRAALAKILMRDPDILLLDEPIKGLDCFSKNEFSKLLRSLANKGKAIVLVSHDIEFCAQNATSISMIFNGSLSTPTTPRDFFSNNTIYTTAASKMSRHMFNNAITDDEVVRLCLER